LEYFFFDRRRLYFAVQRLSDSDRISIDTFEDTTQRILSLRVYSNVKVGLRGAHCRLLKQLGGRRDLRLPKHVRAAGLDVRPENEFILIFISKKFSSDLMYEFFTIFAGYLEFSLSALGKYFPGAEGRLPFAQLNFWRSLIYWRLGSMVMVLKSRITFYSILFYWWLS